MPDPQWAIDAGKSEAEIWKARAEEQLARARACEQRADKAERKLFDAEQQAVHAVGKNATEAIRSLAEERGWGDVDIGSITHLENAPPFDWGFRFRAGGDSFKVAGQTVPGGVTITWWK